jgi:hypothetical protein
MSQDILLKQEKRKWKEEDICQARLRNKRIMQQKHEDIVTKELIHDQMMIQTRELEKLEKSLWIE